MSRKLAAAEIEACARSAHEMNRSFNRLIGDLSYPEWEKAADWIKMTAKLSVIMIAELDASASRLHEAWVAEKRANGWQVGPKNLEAKLHPCLIPYDELPEEQRIKDQMWIDCVKIMINALWRIPQ